jgi:HEAT repeat protein
MQAIDAVERIAERTGQPLPLDPFIAAMADPEPMVRQRATRWLGASGDPRVLPVLVAALGDYDQRAPFAAIAALGELGDPRALEPLRQLARVPDGDRHANLRAAAWAAIARIEARQAG